MPQSISIQSIKNQTLSVRLNENQHVIKLYDIGDGVAMDLTISDVSIFTGFRVLSGAPIAPYQYLIPGAFILFTEDESVVDYTKFGDTQRLVYFTAEEVEAALNV